jgi:ribosome-binding factor A
MDEHRARRISEAVKEELAELIGFEMDDPRLTDIQVTIVEISPDGRHASVRIATETGQEKTALEALDHAKNYLRHEIATRLSLRRVPELHFSVDSHPDADNRIDFLLRRAKRTKARE